MSDFSEPGVPKLPPRTGVSATRTGTPPHPLDNEWFMHVDGEVYGPYSGHQLAEFAKDGRFTPATQVTAAGREDWGHAIDDPRLTALFRRSNAPISPPPVTAAAGSTVVQVTNQIMPNMALLADDGDDAGPKSPGVALLLSLLICGAGQMYCGKVGKGIFMFFSCILLWLVVLGWIINIWSMVDAYQTAKRMNRRYRKRLQMGMVV